MTVIARALGMQKSGVHRLLKSLAVRNLVEQTERGTYVLGFGLVSLATAVSTGEPLVAASVPVLENLADSTGETVFLVTDRGGELKVASKAEGTGFLRAAPEVGATIPAAKTAVGKLYATHAPERLRSVPRFPAELRQQVRSLGHAVNKEEWQPGLSVLAVPVMVRAGFSGALALATVAQRMELLSERKLVRLLKNAAAAMARRLA